VTRDLIIVDIETTGLDPENCMVLEIAAINATTEDYIRIVPKPDRDFNRDDAPALAINRYFERRVWIEQHAYSTELSLLRQLVGWLNGNTLGGSNPKFDLACLTAHCMKRDAHPPKPHHRLADLAAYAAGVDRLPPTELMGLDAICKRLGVVNEAPHSAMGDAQATLECFRKLEAGE
jgi:DNA polymerase-3 subunit epsilon